MLYREIIVCYTITQNKTTLYDQKVEIFNVKPGGIYCNRWT